VVARGGVRVAVVAEFYPRAHDPVLGVWAHRQALAARDAGADVRVLVLHRPVPPRAALAEGPRALARAAGALVAQPRRATLDGLEVEYVPFLAPGRARGYGGWGAWAAPPLAVALRALRRRFPFALVHAHNAVPAGEAVRRAGLRAPLVVSVHGGDAFFTAPRFPAGARAVRATLAAARLALPNSTGIEARCRELGARRTRVVRLGADLPPPAAPDPAPLLVTVAHLVARKRHADVVRAVGRLRARHPALRYLVVGDGPERGPLAALARELGVADRVELAGQLPHPEALRRLRAGAVFAMPSVDEAFGVAYVEALAAGLVVVAARGEPGPEDLAAAGAPLVLVPPGDPDALAAALDGLLADSARRAELGRAGREVVERRLSWRACGEATVAAYGEALA
jgi:teichuronic acid biosynthesis glycosyltransferase TuaC